MIPIKRKESAEIIHTGQLAADVYEMILKTEMASHAVAGQFVAVYTKDASRLLPRPISICETDHEKKTLRLVYRILGAGTKEFSSYQTGQKAELLGTLGNGYPLEPAKGKKILLLGGGIGIPPLLELAKCLQGEKVTIVLGYRDNQMFLKKDFEQYGNVYVATEDGSAGQQGNVFDALEKNRDIKKLNHDIIYSCGPMPMLRAVKRYGKERNIPAYLSMEERMACGIGACLGCVCKTVHKDLHSQVYNARICTEGPVFLAEDVAILPEEQNAGEGDHMRTEIKIAGVTFKNPVMTASGTFGSGMEYQEFVDLNALGAVVTKGVANIPWTGNPTPRIAEVYGGMLNAIGLQNPGIEVFLERDLPFLEQFDTRAIVNVCGKSEQDYIEVAERLNDTSVAMLEINVSCPNVKEGAIAFGQKADALYHITGEIKKHSRKPIIMKLSPNVTDIGEMARAAEAAGADAISLINTLTGMKIDVERQKFVLANKTGGLSGPAIKPVAVRMVYQASQAVNIPIIGMGGIADTEDALEFILAGASAVAVGAMNFVDPYATVKIVKGIEAYMERHHIEEIQELIGAVHE